MRGWEKPLCTHILDRFVKETGNVALKNAHPVPLRFEQGCANLDLQIQSPVRLGFESLVQDKKKN